MHLYKSRLRATCPTCRQVNQANSDGQTALFAAVRHNSGDVIDMLLTAGADIAASDSPFKRTVLHLAARDNHASAIQRLLDAVAQRPTIPKSLLLEARDTDGATPVHTAAQYGAREALIALKVAGADINAQTNDGRTPIFLAAHAGHKKVVRLTHCSMLSLLLFQVIFRINKRSY